MWFSDDMLEIFENTIKTVITDCGYKAVIISMKEHNDNINDQIIAEIRKSKFIIADFTGNRGGVYFESGFAMGLGKQVIWTCRRDHFNSLISTVVDGTDIKDNSIHEVKIQLESKIHFDVDHFNFIIWNNPDELYEKLKNRIEATIL